MIDRSTFADRQARFQLGQCACHAEDFESVVRQEVHSRGSLFMCYEPQSGRLLPPGRWDTLRREIVKGHEIWSHDRTVGLKLGYRNTDFLNSILKYRPEHPLFVDMQDAVYRGANDAPGSLVPVFQYNRIKGATNAVLWPLTRIQDIGARTFVGSPFKDRIRFRQKKPAVFWRGELVGVSKHNDKRTNIQFVIRDFSEGKIGENELLAHLATISRFRFLTRFFGHPRFDVALHISAQTPSYNDVPAIAKFAGNFVRPRDQMQNRYLLALEGNDVATSFIWGATTNSVVLKEEYAWETFYGCHFEPWTHYVPISPDFDDVLEKLEWCDAHPGECKQMIEANHAVCRWLADPVLRDEILRRVATAYDGMFPAGFGLSKASLDYAG